MFYGYDVAARVHILNRFNISVCSGWIKGVLEIHPV